MVRAPGLCLLAHSKAVYVWGVLSCAAARVVGDDRRSPGRLASAARALLLRCAARGVSTSRAPPPISPAAPQGLPATRAALPHLTGRAPRTIPPHRRFWQSMWGARAPPCARRAARVSVAVSAPTPTARAPAISLCLNCKVLHGPAAKALGCKGGVHAPGTQAAVQRGQAGPALRGGARARTSPAQQQACGVGSVPWRR